MDWTSLLFADSAAYERFRARCGKDAIAVDAAADLNLSVIADAIAKLAPDYPREFLLYPDYSAATRERRAEIMAELYENAALLGGMRAFSTALLVLKKTRDAAFQAENPDARNRYFLTAVLRWGECVRMLADLTAQAHAKGLQALHTSVETLLTAPEFAARTADAERLAAEADALFSASLRFDFGHKTVRVEARQTGFADRLEALADEVFGIKLDLSYSVVDSNPLSVMEESILTVMKRRNPSLFARLDDFYAVHCMLDFYELLNLREALLFYTGYLDFVHKMEACGFAFSSAQKNASGFAIHGLYDLSLAVKLGSSQAVVSNDLTLERGEIFVLSGANQGGKTTFLRAFGQCIALAAAGCLVPASDCAMPETDFLATHFNRPETAGKGRLADELCRIRVLLPLVSEKSVVLFNECFVGTRRADAVALALTVFDRLFEHGVTGGFVTHYFELSEKNPRLVSLVAEVADDGSERRSYKITRRPPDGQAHAHSIAVRCGVTYEQLLAAIREQVEKGGAES